MALTARQQAEAIEQFGDDLGKLLTRLDRTFSQCPSATIERLNAVENAEHLDEIAESYRRLGAELCDECDAAEEAEHRRRMTGVGGKANGGSAA